MSKSPSFLETQFKTKFSQDMIYYNAYFLCLKFLPPASWHLLYTWVLLASFKGFLSFETGSHFIDLAGFELKRSAWLCLSSAGIRGACHQLVSPISFQCHCIGDSIFFFSTSHCCIRWEAISGLFWLSVLGYMVYHSQGRYNSSNMKPLVPLGAQLDFSFLFHLWPMGRVCPYWGWVFPPPLHVSEENTLRYTEYVSSKSSQGNSKGQSPEGPSHIQTIAIGNLTIP